MVAAINNTDMTAIVDEIFGAMAGMQLLPCQDVVAPGSSNGYVVAAVQIVGEWQGAVRLDVSLELARRACANLTGVDEGELSQQDVRDAAGELANMVGGSVKALVSHTSRLSLPTVAIGRDFEFSLCQGTLIQELSFSHASGWLKVSVIEKRESSLQKS